MAGSRKRAQSTSRRRTKLSPEVLSAMAVKAVKAVKTSGRGQGITYAAPRQWKEDNRVPLQQFSVTARMVDGPASFLARVNVLISTIPEVPDVVTIENMVFTLVNTAPMTYVRRNAGEATRV